MLKNPDEFFIKLNSFLNARGIRLSPSVIIQLAETNFRAEALTEGDMHRKFN